MVALVQPLICNVYLFLRAEFWAKFHKNFCERQQGPCHLLIKMLQSRRRYLELEQDAIFHPYSPFSSIWHEIRLVWTFLPILWHQVFTMRFNSLYGYSTYRYIENRRIKICCEMTLRRYVRFSSSSKNHDKALKSCYFWMKIIEITSTTMLLRRDSAEIAYEMIIELPVAGQCLSFLYLRQMLNF